MSAPRTTLLFAVFFVGFWVTSTAVRRLVLPPVSHGLRLKTEYLAAHRDAYDVIYFGSSRINHALIPATVDARLTAAGFPYHSFNFGIGGMRSFETEHTIERVLEDPSPRLRWIVIEWPEWEAEIDGDVLTDRNIYWHTPALTLTALESVRRAPLPLGDRVKAGLDHLTLFAANVTNYGRGTTVARTLLGIPEVFDGLPDFISEDGYASTSVVRERTAAYERRRARALRVFEERPDYIDVGNRRSPDPGEYNLTALRAQLARAQALDIRVLYVVLPGQKPMPHAWSFAAKGMGAPILLFNSPSRYPELYAPGIRYDPEHLNRSGAEIFSRIFAEAFVQVLESS